MFPFSTKKKQPRLFPDFLDAFSVGEGRQAPIPGLEGSGVRRGPGIGPGTSRRVQQQQLLGDVEITWGDLLNLLA